MKILHLSNLYYPSVGGNEIHISKLSKKLVDLGDEVAIFSTKASNMNMFKKKTHDVFALPSVGMEGGVKIKRFTICKKLNDLIFNQLIHLKGGWRIVHFFFKDAYKLLSNGPFVPQVIWHIIISRPDVVMVLNSSSAFSYFAYLAKKIAKFPLVITPCLHIGSSWVEDPLIYKIMRSSDLVIAFTEFEKEYLVKKGVSEKNIVVIGVGVDPDDFKAIDKQFTFSKYKENNESIILFVGRKEKDKGVEALIKAIEIIWEKKKNIKLILAGSSCSNDKTIREMISALNPELQNKIELIEDFTEKEKSLIYNSCDIFAMPSNSDSFGIAYLEAWLHKKPVVACKDTAQDSIVTDGLDGLLVEFDNKEALANAVLNLLENEDLRRSMGLNGRNKVLRNYTWDIIARKIRNEYYKVVKDKKYYKDAN